MEAHSTFSLKTFLHDELKPAYGLDICIPGMNGERGNALAGAALAALCGDAEEGVQR